MDKSSTNNKESDKVNNIFTLHKSNQLSDPNWHDLMTTSLFDDDVRQKTGKDYHRDKPD